MNPTKIIRCVLCVLMLSAVSFSVSAQTFTSVQDGDWNDGGTWNQGGATPSFGNNVVIAGHNVTIDATSFCSNLTLQTGGQITIDAALTIISNVVISGSSTITGNGTNTLGVAGNFSVNSGTTTLANTSLDIGGSAILNGDLDITNTSGTKRTDNLTFSGGDLIFSVAATFLVDETMSLSGTSSVDGTAVGTFTVTGSSTLSSGTLTVGGVNASFGGTVTVNSTLAFDNTTGDKTFQNISVAGTWNNTVAESFTINGNIVNDGTWNGCSNNDCVYTLTNASGTISGSGIINIPDMIIDAGDSYTNSGVVAIGDRLTGTGEFINGNGTSGSLTYYGDNSAGSNFDITTFTATAIGNTVIYSGTTDQLLRQTSDVNNTYYNLIINTSAAGNDVTLDAASTVSNQLTMITGDLILGNEILTIGDGATITSGDTDSFIQDSGTGVVRYEVSTTGSDLYVPIGGANFSPITVNLSSTSFGGSPSIDFSITDSAHPNRDRDNTSDSPAGDDDGTAATDYLDVYWTISGNNITNPVYTAEYTYDGSDFTQTTEGNMVPALYRSVGGTQDWLALGSVNATSNTASMTRGDGFGDLYAMDNSMERLPVNLLSFTSKVAKSSIVLNWSTTSEENNSHFLIQRSVDGINYKQIGIVEGHGTIEDVRTYTFEDKFPLEGRSYYRLKQVDFNGQFEYSEVISVMWKSINQGSQLSVYPSLIGSGEVLNVDVSDVNSEKFSWMISDLNGKRFAVGEVLDSSHFECNTIGLNPGVYVFRIIQKNGKSSSEKFIVR